MSRSKIMQIRKRRSRSPHDLHHIGDFRLIQPKQVSTHSFSGYPPPQVTRTTTWFLLLDPVVIRRRNRRMTSVREMLRFRIQPRLMGRIGCSDERERPAESVVHLLVVSFI